MADAIVDELIKKRETILDYLDEEYRASMSVRENAAIRKNVYAYQQMLEFFQEAINLVLGDAEFRSLPKEIEDGIAFRLESAEDFHNAFLQEYPQSEKPNLDFYHKEREDFRHFLNKNKKLEVFEQTANLTQVLSLFGKMDLPDQIARKISEYNLHLDNAMNVVKAVAADKAQDNVQVYDVLTGKLSYHKNKSKKAMNDLAFICSEVTNALSGYFASWRSESLKSQWQAMANDVNARVKDDRDEIVLINEPAKSAKTPEQQSIEALEALQKLKEHKLFSAHDLQQRLVLLEEVNGKLDALPKGSSALLQDPRFKNVVENRMSDIVDHYSDLNKNQKARFQYVIEKSPLSSSKIADLKNDIGFWGQLKAGWYRFLSIFSSAYTSPAWDPKPKAPDLSVLHNATLDIEKRLQKPLNKPKPAVEPKKDFDVAAVFSLFDNIINRMKNNDIRNPKIAIKGLQNDLDSVLAIQKNIGLHKNDFPQEYKKASDLAVQVKHLLEVEIRHANQHIHGNRQAQQKFYPKVTKKAEEIELVEIKPRNRNKAGNQPSSR